MSFQICIKTDKSLHQLATEIYKLFSLPVYQYNSFAGEPYYQFEVLGMFLLIRQADEDERDPEVASYPYRFDMQFSFIDHELDTDDLEYRLQPYYAQLLAFHLGLETAYYEKQKVGHHWQMRYHFCHKNPHWDGSILYGEPGWQAAVIVETPTPWRTLRPLF